MPTEKKKSGLNNTLARYFGDLTEAGLSGDNRKVQLVALSAIRALKKEAPKQAENLGKILATFSANPGALRRNNNAPPPEDSDGGMSLLQFPTVTATISPVFTCRIKKQIELFEMERKSSDKLLAAGIEPPRSILLKGPPGTGKTALSGWLANSLNLPLVVLDLATAISSYLGKTGSNIKRCLNYGRAHPCVFLLDEFDSIAKRRDHSDDVGELKRIVTVLLKELEDWPFSSVLVAATNHPEMLDPAIERRFDIVLDIPLPDLEARRAILIEKLGTFQEEVSATFLDGFSLALDTQSGSEIETIVQTGLRHHLISEIPLARSLGEVFAQRRASQLTKPSLGELIKLLKEEGKLTVRDIAPIVDLSSSGVQHHLKKKS
ncbi:AAA family ATPase (plasmid) [Verrucomicrobiaceae bacterium 227]